MVSIPMKPQALYFVLSLLLINGNTERVCERQEDGSEKCSESAEESQMLKAAKAQQSVLHFADIKVKTRIISIQVECILVRNQFICP